MADGSSLVQANIHFLEQGVHLLDDIDDEMYVITQPSQYNSGIGKHFRHILDHYLSLVEHKQGKIDYDARERDGRIETDRGYAISLAIEIIGKLRPYSEDGSLIREKVSVRSNEGAKTGDSPWSSSSIKRELQFLISHTVHHYALIAVILRIQGYDPGEEFGVAPSTLQYQREQLKNAAG